MANARANTLSHSSADSSAARDARQVVVAVDAMGGDHAPDEIVAGAVLAQRQGIARPILVGDEKRIGPLLEREGVKIEVVACDAEIPMDASPSRVVRECEGTSLKVAIDLVRNGRAESVVSAGNSGAFLAVALFALRTISGVARPAIAVVMPAKDGPVVLLDCGANVDCKPEWLAQFGIMGSAYARGVLGIHQPRVGVVSVGEERAKGNAQAIEAARLLEQAPIHFIGNVEGKDMLTSVADVIVTDGFIGNVMLKLTEGVAQRVAEIAREEVLEAGSRAKIGTYLLKPALRRVRDKIVYDKYGGAPLLGLRGNCIVAHGRAKREAIRNAIRTAATEAQADVVSRIASLVEPFDARAAR